MAAGRSKCRTLKLMSLRNPNVAAPRRITHAPVFAALGDVTRLSLVRKRCARRPCSTSHLTRGSRRARQAITQLLRVVEVAGIVHSSRTGRESLYEFDPRPIHEVRCYLDQVSAEWDQALSRLRAF